MTQPLWTKDEVLRVADGDGRGDDWVASGVSIDTRTLEPGDLFVAIVGEKMDGHGFVAQAFEAGAAAALVSQVTPEMEAAGPLVVVEDTLDALNRLGCAARARAVAQGAKIVAVTGSVGKTGTKEALRAVFGRQGRTHASVASYNNLWGVPLSLARMPADTEFGIFEVGMNHAGEIRPLVAMIEPDVAIITTVEPVHLEFFSSVEEIADAKAEIFEGLKPGGAVILNKDNGYYDRLAARAEACGVVRVISFGQSETASVRLHKSVLHEACSCVAADVCGQAMTYKIGLPGRHIVMNSLAVLGCVHALDGDLALAALELATLAAQKGRGQRHTVALDGGDFTLIDESYNANPASMRAVFEALGKAQPAKRGRRIVVLGDMLELGDDGPALHKELALPLAQAKADLVFACGPLMKGLFDRMPLANQGGYGADSAALTPMVSSAVRAGDVVVVKGSLGSRMGYVVDGLLSLSAETLPSAAHIDAGGR